ncbi:IS66 family insertion sequence element accessory protein TnpB [Anoxybacteroides voinovskiense]|uniref:IS66 family insertion sequence element accessory protein TnpB n=1 Tax=Anoxybacteroides voinovskiense TaxID=230470 RepID=UPI001606B6B6
MKQSILPLKIHIFQLNPFSSSLLVFCNRGQDKLKILHWNHNDFWLYYCRLERGTFYWPSNHRSEPLKISPHQLRWLLDGLSLEQAHSVVTARKVI